jgi:lipopolysaccharide biosynthesis regulator YciM
MYTKILLVFVIIILSAFFYLHTQNPGAVTFVVTTERTYVMPVTLLLFMAFVAGAVLSVLNSLAVDAKRAIREMKARREAKALAQAEEHYRKGVESLTRGNTSSARELLEKALRGKPSDKGVVISLAETYIRENRPKEALKVLEGGLVGNPDSIGMQIAVSKCASDMGDNARASKALVEVLKVDPKNPYSLKRLRDLKIKDSLWSEAADIQKTAAEVERDPGARGREKRLLAGLLFEAASRHVEDGALNEAIGRVKEVLKCDASFMPAHILLGEALYRQGNVAGALKVWEKALLKFQNPEPLFLKLEDAYLGESAPEKILERYRREIIARPNDVNLRLLLSRLYLRLEMVDDAIEELERLQQDGEETTYPRVLLGEAYLRRKQGHKAAMLFYEALGLDRELQPPFACSGCSYNSKTWTPRCPACGEWNTFAMNAAQAPAANKGPATPWKVRL